MRTRAWPTLLSLPLAGCTGMQSALDPAGDQARTISSVWHLMLVVCGFMFVLTMILLVLALLRGRRGAGNDDAETAQRHEAALSRALYGWIALVVVGLVVLALGSFFADRKLSQGSSDPLRVRITGNQWWWEVEYPGADASCTVVTANELHLPVDREADIELRTHDVIHSLWIPNLAGKLDLIPGRVNTLRVTPRRIGALRGQCAEFCGLQHAWMALDVTVESSDAFGQWRAHQLAPAKPPATAAAQEGARVFAGKPCVMCHAIMGSDASARNGPDLTHVASRKTIAAGARPMSRESLRAWLADPQRIKPGAHMPAVPMTDDELGQLVEYLMTLD